MTRLGFIFAAAISLAFLSGARAEVVQPAPNFSFLNEKGRVVDLRSSHARAVVLIVAPSPQSRAFRQQAKEIAGRLRFFTNRKVILVAAFTEGAGTRPSGVPLFLANDARRVAETFEMHDSRFAVFVIGPDGNVDLRTAHVSRSQKLLDVIDNSFAVQLAARKS